MAWLYFFLSLTRDVDTCFPCKDTEKKRAHISTSASGRFNLLKNICKSFFAVFTRLADLVFVLKPCEYILVCDSLLVRRCIHCLINDKTESNDFRIFLDATKARYLSHTSEFVSENISVFAKYIQNHQKKSEGRYTIEDH